MIEEEFPNADLQSVEDLRAVLERIIQCTSLAQAHAYARAGLAGATQRVRQYDLASLGEVPTTDESVFDRWDAYDGPLPLVDWLVDQLIRAENG